MLLDMIRQNRSCRRFHQDQTIELTTLKSLVDLARLSASAANLQPLKYILSCQVEKNAVIFECLAWAGYLTEWPGPAEGERPAGYIVILGDTRISKNFWCDHGIASQSILLGAREAGLAGCIFGAIKRERLRKALEIPDHLEIMLVIALGSPKESVQLETVGPEGDIRYWRDDEGVHHVPKRPLEDITVDAY